MFGPVAAAASVPSTHPEVLGAPSVLGHVADGQHASHGAVAVLLQVLVDEPVETDTQLRQDCVHVLPVHGLPHVLHLPTDVGTDLGAGLRGRDADKGAPRLNNQAIQGLLLFFVLQKAMQLSEGFESCIS